MDAAPAKDPTRSESAQLPSVKCAATPLALKSTAGRNADNTSRLGIPAAQKRASASTVQRRLHAIAAPLIPKDVVNPQRMARNGRTSTSAVCPSGRAGPDFAGA